MNVLKRLRCVSQSKKSSVKVRRVTVGSGMEDGKSLANNGSDSLCRSTERAVVVTATASVVRRRSSTDQTERHPL